MRDIIYDVAVSLDGFIAAPDGDVSAFPMEGDHVADYHDRLANYATVIMGRGTYEFGYAYGLDPGARAYPHMDHHIFTTSGAVPADKDVTVHAQDSAMALETLRASNEGPIYLCGGGQFAGFVANAGQLNEIIIKRIPVVLGAGIGVFAGLESSLVLAAVETKTYANGVRLERYRITGSS